ncbi:Acetylornithine deacetylase/succinyldiaminopimelate desuccinylase-like deacylase [metagenome]|uniref:Acetylornithine deacetylase/succinyldiaminopimelate desuccinylase-like deacylase n=1 Tax=metagenome TaxID=256318 RepID=A0A2P2C173_9ZZZZ
MSAVERMLGRLEHLVMAETPSGDAGRLRAAHVLLQDWGQEALGRRGEERVVDAVPHLLWEAAAQPRVLVLGHLDTVFPAGVTRQRPFAIDGDRVTGPGVFDMKAGLVVALEALSRVVDPSHVSLLVTGDEETGSSTSRALIEDVARGCSAVLVLEPSLEGALKTGRKGGSIYRVGFEGRAAHAGLEPELGRNALIELARLVLWCESVADPGLGTTVTPTRAESGTTNNVVPAFGELVLDVRASTAAELDRVHRALVGRVPVDPGVRLVIGGGLNRPPLEPTSSTTLVELARAVAVREGLPLPRTTSVGGASDANFTAALGIATLDGLGAVGAGAHTDQEWVEIASLERQVSMVAGLIEDLRAPDNQQH